MTDETFSVDEEWVDRVTLWQSLLDRGLASGVSASFTSRERLRSGGRLYSPGRGIWRDKSRLGGLPGVTEGITVSVLHTGDGYDDAVDSAGISYRDPETSQPGADHEDILATKVAEDLEMPIFVITTERRGRNIHLGWVVGCDDAARTFEIEFQRINQPPARGNSGRRRFQWEVLHTYGSQCAVCPSTNREMLTDVALIPFDRGGPEELDNGIVLCKSHKSMLDGHAYRFDPDTTRIVARDGGTLDALSIEFPDLSHLPRRPNRRSLAWRWDNKVG